MNLDFYKKALLQEIKELESLADIAQESAQTVELDQAKVGRLSRMDAMQQQAMQVAQNQRRVERLRQIKAALTRIQQDEFGWCLMCGEEIPVKRLEVNPAATHCTQCADQQN